MTYVVYGGLIVVVLVALHLAALWAEGRGWIFYRNQSPPPGATARAANTLAALVQPEFQHVVDAEALIEEAGHDGA